MVTGLSWCAEIVASSTWNLAKRSDSSAIVPPQPCQQRFVDRVKGSAKDGPGVTPKLTLNHYSRTSTGTLMSATSTSPAPFTFWAACSMALVGPSFTGRSETMKENEFETIIQRARELDPGAKPRIITDNGPQFIARDVKEFIRICGVTHVKTARYYPQSNGKIERWHETLNGDCIRPQTSLSLEDARRVVTK
jgi:transposase InsO family protein